VVADYCGVDGGFELPDPGSLPDPRAAATAQELLRYLAQPFSICEAFTAMPGESTSYPDLLEAVETIVGVG
jgi:F0F1-type ATP synthase beta subunit